MPTLILSCDKALAYFSLDGEWYSGLRGVTREEGDA